MVIKRAVFTLAVNRVVRAIFDSRSCLQNMLLHLYQQYDERKYHRYHFHINIPLFMHRNQHIKYQLPIVQKVTSNRHPHNQNVVCRKCLFFSILGIENHVFSNSNVMSSLLQGERNLNMMFLSHVTSTCQELLFCPILALQVLDHPKS